MYMKLLTSFLILTFMFIGCSGNDNGSSSDGNASGDQKVMNENNSNENYEKEDVRKAIANIHGLYNKEEYKQLYGMATQSMKEKLNEAQFTELLGNMRDKLGKVKSANITDMSNHAESGRVIVELDVDYQNDSGSEKWTLIMGKGDLEWGSFNYNAPSL